MRRRALGDIWNESPAFNAFRGEAWMPEPWLDFAPPGFGEGTGCYEVPDLTGLLDVVTELAYSFVPGVYCASPTGAFL